MTSISERTPFQLGIVVLLLGLVGGLAYQQGLIQAKVPQTGEYLRNDVFNVWAAGFSETMGVRFGAMEKMGAHLESLEVRMASVEREIARMSVALEGKKDVVEPAR